MLKAEIYITLKNTVSDPQGLTVKHALDSLGFKRIEEVRIGKLVIVKLNSQDKDQGQKEIEQMCRKLLANPIIEDYHFRISEG